MDNDGVPRYAALGDEDARLLRENAASVCVPLPRLELVADLASALRKRRTERTMSGETLSTDLISTLLGFGAGSAGAVALPLVVGAPPASRTYPSGGALYPIELLVHPLQVRGVERAWYHYQVLSHRLSLVDDSPPLVNGVESGVDRMLRENGVTGAGVVFLFWIDCTRPSLAKYGEKANRLALLEAGHLGQNLLLLAGALGLSSAALCGFDDETLTTEAGLRYPDQAIIYAICVGGSIGLQTRGT